MYKVVGMESKKIYATGHRSECMRKLQSKYDLQKPEKRWESSYYYPEPLIIRRNEHA